MAIRVYWEGRRSMLPVEFHGESQSGGKELCRQLKTRGLSRVELEGVASRAGGRVLDCRAYGR
jgi:transposase-like protein